MKIYKMSGSCSSDSCCSDEGKFSGRHFLTADEKIAKLQEYKDWLDSESKGVEEKISDLKKAS